MVGNRAQYNDAESSRSYCKDEHFAAAFYGVSVGTVRRWRGLGTGPRYRKIGNLVRYSIADLEDWLASRPTGGERAEGAKNV
jgi:predicted DNA-binding transcriptional regulator AlpA